MRNLSWLPKLEEGYYETLYNLSLHKTPGLSYLTKGKLIKIKSRIWVKAIRRLHYSVWGKTKEGWICLYMNQKFLVRRVGNTPNELTHPLDINLELDEEEGKE